MAIAQHRFSIDLRIPIRLEAFSVLSRIMRSAVYPGDFPPTQETFWTIFHDFHSALKADRLEWLHRDRIEFDIGSEIKQITVDLKNSQFIGADTGVSHFRGGYEPDILAVIERCVPRDGVFVDVGANWGYFSIYLALRPEFAGRILSLEPSHNSYRDLYRLVSDLGLQDRIIPVPLAAGDTSGPAAMTAEVFSGNNKVAENGADPIYRERLDHIVQSSKVGRVDVMKFDVEGHEPEALAGALWSIRQFAPVVIFESWKTDEVTTLRPFEVITRSELHYRFYLAEGISTPLDGSRSATFSGDLVQIAPSDRMEKEDRLNVIAIPDERRLKALLA